MDNFPPLDPRHFCLHNQTFHCCSFNQTFFTFIQSTFTFSLLFTIYHSFFTFIQSTLTFVKSTHILKWDNPPPLSHFHKSQKTMFHTSQFQYLPDYQHENNYVFPQLFSSMHHAGTVGDDDEIPDPLDDFSTDEDLFEFLLDNSTHLSKQIVKKFDTNHCRMLVSSLLKILPPARGNVTPRNMNRQETYDECLRTAIKETIFKISCKNFSVVMSHISNALLEKCVFFMLETLFSPCSSFLSSFLFFHLVPLFPPLFCFLPIQV